MTATTHNVRNAYALTRRRLMASDPDLSIGTAEFDAWLVSVEREAAAKALEHAAIPHAQEAARQLTESLRYIPGEVKSYHQRQAHEARSIVNDLNALAREYREGKR